MSGTWNVLISSFLPIEIFLKITSILPPSPDNGAGHLLCRPSADDGKFSVRSAYQLGDNSPSFSSDL